MPRPRKAVANKTGTGVAYQTIVVLPIAAKEGCDCLTPGQYLHIKDQIKQLVGFGRKEFDFLLRIEALEEFWELKDKGGTLGKKNIRVYFYFDPPRNEIVVLSTIKKEEEGPTPRHIVLRLRNRLRMYKNGDFGPHLIRYQRPS